MSNEYRTRTNPALNVDSILLKTLFFGFPELGRLFNYPQQIVKTKLKSIFRPLTQVESSSTVLRTLQHSAFLLWAAVQVQWLPFSSEIPSRKSSRSRLQQMEVTSPSVTRGIDWFGPKSSSISSGDNIPKAQSTVGLRQAHCEW